MRLAARVSDAAAVAARREQRPSRFSLAPPPLAPERAPGPPHQFSGFRAAPRRVLGTCRPLLASQGCTDLTG